jgi:photosystem II stability/assembly factor-like uncharacterized protein
MTRFLTVVAAIMFFAIPLFSQNTWTRQPSGYSENFKKVVFTDSLYGWIAGDSGLIINTTNGGSNWVTQSRNTNDFLIDFFFLDRLYGWGIAWRVMGSAIQSVMYKTTNGGNNWTTYIYTDSSTLLNTVHFINPQSGFLGCSYTSTKAILRTTNSGVNWFPANVDTNFASYFPVKKFKFMNSNTGFAVGGYFDICGVVWKTTDGGISWSTKTVGGEPFNAIDFPNANTVVLSGGDYEYGVSVSYSTNTGESWNWNFAGYFGIGYSLSFRTSTEGWIAAGFSQMFLKTTDAGLSWGNVKTPDSAYVYSLIFPNQKTGWAVGDNGTILKFTGNPIGINNQGNIIPGKTSLFPNYPNPFNPRTVVRFQLSVVSVVSLKVYDIAGREVQTLVNEELQPGTYKVTFDGSQLNSGVYFYTFNSGDFKETRKMILMK